MSSVRMSAWRPEAEVLFVQVREVLIDLARKYALVPQAAQREVETAKTGEEINEAQGSRLPATAGGVSPHPMSHAAGRPSCGYR